MREPPTFSLPRRIHKHLSFIRGAIDVKDSFLVYAYVADASATEAPREDRATVVMKIGRNRQARERQGPAGEPFLLFRIFFFKKIVEKT